MLIDVFGVWINPEKINYLEEKMYNDRVQTRIIFLSDAFLNTVCVYDKTAKELAEEINVKWRERNKQMVRLGYLHE